MIVKSNELRKRWLYCLILVFVTILLFANTLNNDFTYDDYPVVISDPQIKYWHFWDLWEVWGRSTRTLSLMVDYHIFGDSPFGYHAQNILWHLLSVLLLFFLFVKLSGNQFTSFIAALFFAVHPIHVEAVANIANRKELICMFFSLSSFLLYLTFLQAEYKKKWLWLLAGMLSWYLALNSKQVAFILPLSMVAYEYVFLPKGKRFLSKKPILLLTGLATVSIVAFYQFVGNMEFVKEGYRGELSLISAIITQPKTFWMYMKLLLFPLNLSPDYCVGIASTLKDTLVVLTWVAAAGAILLPFIIIRRAPLISFGLFWFIIHYMAISNIVPSAYFVADRYMYIPSAGFSLAIVSFGKKVYDGLFFYNKNNFAIIITTLLFITLLASYSINTITYNAVWLNGKKLWGHAIEVNPNYQVYFNRGLAYIRSDKYRQAIMDFNKSIQLNPMSAKTYYNRGSAYNSLAKYSQAIRDFNKSIQLNPMSEKTYYNRGNAYTHLGNHQQAVKNYSKAIELDHKSAQAYNNRGSAYVQLGNNRQAVKDFSMAIELDNKVADAYYNRGNIYRKLSKYSKAIKDYKNAVLLNPKDADAFYYLGLVHSKLGNAEQSRLNFQKAKKLGRY